MTFPNKEMADKARISKNLTRLSFLNEKQQSKRSKLIRLTKLINFKQFVKIKDHSVIIKGNITIYIFKFYAYLYYITYFLHFKSRIA